MGIEFLSLDEVLDIHRDQVTRYGGSHGVRDLGGLQSALAVPQAGIGGEYFHSDPVEMAAAYLFHIVRNHPFVDGNKRVGAMASFTFLRLNGWHLRAPHGSFEELILAIAAGKAGKDAAGVFLRKHTSKEKLGSRKLASRK
jgi:death-on-curing protein